jgi:hypothetical protein
MNAEKSVRKKIKIKKNKMGALLLEKKRKAMEF